jgi:hypothetical protein
LHTGANEGLHVRELKSLTPLFLKLEGWSLQLKEVWLLFLAAEL